MFQSKDIRTPTCSSICWSCSPQSAPCTRWSGTCEWTGACLTVELERTSSSGRKLFIHTRLEGKGIPHRSHSHTHTHIEPDPVSPLCPGLLLLCHYRRCDPALCLDNPHLSDYNDQDPLCWGHRSNRAGSPGGLQVDPPPTFLLFTEIKSNMMLYNIWSLLVLWWMKRFKEYLRKSCIMMIQDERDSVHLFSHWTVTVRPWFIHLYLHPSGALCGTSSVWRTSTWTTAASSAPSGTFLWRRSMLMTRRCWSKWWTRKTAWGTARAKRAGRGPTACRSAAPCSPPHSKTWHRRWSSGLQTPSSLFCGCRTKKILMTSYRIRKKSSRLSTYLQHLPSTALGKK